MNGSVGGPTGDESIDLSWLLYINKALTGGHIGRATAIDEGASNDVNE